MTIKGLFEINISWTQNKVKGKDVYVQTYVMYEHYDIVIQNNEWYKSNNYVSKISTHKVLVGHVKLRSDINITHNTHK